MRVSVENKAFARHLSVSESSYICQLARMNYETMFLFGMNRRSDSVVWLWWWNIIVCIFRNSLNWNRLMCWRTFCLMCDNDRIRKTGLSYSFEKKRILRFDGDMMRLSQQFFYFAENCSTFSQTSQFFRSYSHHFTHVFSAGSAYTSFFQFSFQFFRRKLFRKVYASITIPEPFLLLPGQRGLVLRIYRSWIFSLFHQFLHDFQGCIIGQGIVGTRERFLLPGNISLRCAKSPVWLCLWLSWPLWYRC